MGESMRTQLVSAIHLQEVELQDNPADKQQGTGHNNNNGEFEMNNWWAVKSLEVISMRTGETGGKKKRRVCVCGH